MTAEERFKLLCSPLHWAGLILYPVNHCQQCEGFRAHPKPRQLSELPLTPPCKNIKRSCIINLLIIKDRVLIFTSYSLGVVCLYWWFDMMIFEVFLNLNNPIILTHWEVLGFLWLPTLPVCLPPPVELRLFLELCGCAHSELRYCPEYNKTL